MKKSSFAIIGAMDEEISAFVSELEGMTETEWNLFRFYEGSFHGVQAVVVRCGVGKVLSSALTQHIIDRYSPRGIIVTGLAGALNETYEIGDIVVGSELMQHDLDATALGFARGDIPYTPGYRTLEGDPKLVESALSYRSAEHRVHKGRILTGDTFITGESSKGLLSLRGDAVEMEGASIGVVCKMNNVPFVVIRTISDRADHSATVDFSTFLPEASRNSLGVVRHVLSTGNT